MRRSFEGHANSAREDVASSAGNVCFTSGLRGPKPMAITPRRASVVRSKCEDVLAPALTSEERLGHPHLYLVP